MGQSKGSRMVDNKGRSERRLKCKCHECGKFGLGMNAREASAFEASKRVLAETTYVDMARVDLNTLEIGSFFVAREKSRFSEWNRIVCRGDGVRFAWFEKLQVLFGSECSKGDRQAPRCVILSRESENGRDVHSFDGSVRDEPHEPRCVLPFLLQGYRVFRTMLGRLARTAIRFVLTFGAEQIEDLTITIANSVYTRCVRRARQWALQKECRKGFSSLVGVLGVST